MIDVCWENESKTIIRQDYTKYWNWQEYTEAMQTTYDMMDKKGTSVDIIMNLGDDGMLPWEAFCSGHCAPFVDSHPNQGIQVAVTSSRFKQFANLFSRLYPEHANKIQFHVVEDMLEAYAIIQDKRVVQG